MSKASQSVELQRLTEHSQNGMSGHVDPTHFEVGSVPPVYFSVDEAKSATKDFQSGQVGRETGQDYTVPGDRDPPNEYDIITDKQREATAPGFTFKQENILYADSNAAQEMRHQTLTMERIGQQKYAGKTTPGDVHEPKGRGWCKCKTKDVCVWLFICLLLALVVAALVLVVMVIVGVIVPVCDCAATPEEVQRLQAMMETLSRTQAEIESMVNVLNTSRINTTMNVNSLTQRLDTFDVTPQVETAIAARITDNGTIIGVNYSAILRDFEPFSDCTTAIERQCIISSAMGNNRCETADLNYISTSGELTYTRDVQCLRLPGSLETNPVLATLVIENNIAFCLCYRTIENPTAVLRDVSCGLQITRCKEKRDIPVDIVTTATRT